MHDCSGLGPRSSGAPGRWARELGARGYVTVIPDSFTTRGHPDGVCTDASPSRGEVGPGPAGPRRLRGARPRPRAAVRGRPARGPDGRLARRLDHARLDGRAGERLGAARPREARGLRRGGGALSGLRDHARHWRADHRDLPPGRPAPDPDRRERRLDAGRALREAGRVHARERASGRDHGLPGRASLLRQRPPGALRGRAGESATPPAGAAPPPAATPPPGPTASAAWPSSSENGSSRKGEAGDHLGIPALGMACRRHGGLRPRRQARPALRLRPRQRDRGLAAHRHRARRAPPPGRPDVAGGGGRGLPGQRDHRGLGRDLARHRARQYARGRGRLPGSSSASPAAASAFERPRGIFAFAAAVVAGRRGRPRPSASRASSLGGFAPRADVPAIWITWALGDITGALIVAAAPDPVDRGPPLPGPARGSRSRRWRCS